MRVQRTHTKQLRAPLTTALLLITRSIKLCAPLTTTLGHPKSMQYNVNSCSFNYKADYIRVCYNNVISMKSFEIGAL